MKRCSNYNDISKTRLDEEFTLRINSFVGVMEADSECSTKYEKLTNKANKLEKTSDFQQLKNAIEKLSTYPKDSQDVIKSLDSKNIKEILKRMILLREKAKNKLGGKSRYLYILQTNTYEIQGDYFAVNGDIQQSLNSYVEAILNCEEQLNFLIIKDSLIDNPSEFGEILYHLGILYFKMSKVLNSNWDYMIESLIISSMYYEKSTLTIGNPTKRFEGFYYAGMMNHRLIYQFYKRSEAKVFIDDALELYNSAYSLTNTENMVLKGYIENVNTYLEAHIAGFGIY